MTSELLGPDGRPLAEKSALLEDCCYVCKRSFILDRRRYILMAKPDFLMNVKKQRGTDGRRWRIIFNLLPPEECIRVCAPDPDAPAPTECAWLAATQDGYALAPFTPNVRYRG